MFKYMIQYWKPLFTRRKLVQNLIQNFRVWSKNRYSRPCTPISIYLAVVWSQKAWERWLVGYKPICIDEKTVEEQKRSVYRWHVMYIWPCIPCTRFLKWSPGPHSIYTLEHFTSYSVWRERERHGWSWSWWGVDVMTTTAFATVAAGMMCRGQRQSYLSA
jgi:hypothetical protein